MKTKTENKLLNFAFDDNLIRVAAKSGQTWFVASDVCKILKIVNPRAAVSALEADERNTVIISDGIQRGNPKMNIINEPGLYRLIFKSRTAAAKTFQKWVFSDLLPTLRQTGSYSTTPKLSEEDAKKERVQWLMSMGSTLQEAFQLVYHGKIRKLKPTASAPTPKPPVSTGYTEADDVQFFADLIAEEFLRKAGGLETRALLLTQMLPIARRHRLFPGLIGTTADMLKLLNLSPQDTTATPIAEAHIPNNSVITTWAKRVGSRLRGLIATDTHGIRYTVLKRPGSRHSTFEFNRV